MIVVHHLEQSRSQRLLWLLEELSAPYEVVHHRRDPVTRLAPPELTWVHSLGKSPVIIDGDHVLAETGAIFEYLCRRYDSGHRLSPEAAAFDPPALSWRYWLHYAEGSAMPALAMKQVLGGVGDAGTKVSSGFVDPQLRLHADYWERELERSGWLVGDAFSAADVIMSFPIEMALSRFHEALGARPTLVSYLDRLHARDGYAQSQARGTPTA